MREKTLKLHKITDVTEKERERERDKREREIQGVIEEEIL